MIADGNALGHEVSWLVVVRHDDVDSLGAHHLDLDRGGNAIVDRDDEIGVAALDHALERLGGKAVTLAETPGNVGVHLGAKVTKRERKEAGRAHAVHVEVAKDGNSLTVAHGSLDAVSRGGQAGKLERVMPIPVKRRGEEPWALLASRMPRATMTRATSGDTPQAMRISCSAATSPGSRCQRPLSRRPLISTRRP